MSSSVDSADSPPPIRTEIIDDREFSANPFHEAFDNKSPDFSTLSEFLEGTPVSRKI
jgi:hypothetical protein